MKKFYLLTILLICILSSGINAQCKTFKVKTKSINDLAAKCNITLDLMTKPVDFFQTHTKYLGYNTGTYSIIYFGDQPVQPDTGLFNNSVGTYRIISYNCPPQPQAEGFVYYKMGTYSTVFFGKAGNDYYIRLTFLVLPEGSMYKSLESESVDYIFLNSDSLQMTLGNDEKIHLFPCNCDYKSDPSNSPVQCLYKIEKDQLEKLSTEDLSLVTLYSSTNVHDKTYQVSIDCRNVISCYLPYSDMKVIKSNTTFVSNIEDEKFKENVKEVATCILNR